MDLRGKLSSAQIDRACSILNYQPFIITDDIQTGAAYSWMYGVNVRSQTPTLFKKQDFEASEWGRISDANERLRKMYDAFVLEIVSRYVGGSFLDVACNNGYFPVKAQKLGMSRAVGADGGAYFQSSIQFLNEVLGTEAEFIPALYDARLHSAPIEGTYNVVSASAIMCHLPDPLNFLAFLGSLATDAIFYFGQIVDTDALIVSYLQPHPSLALTGIDMPFPYRFNDVTRLSRGLLYHGLEEMGFKNIIQIPWSDEWLPPYFYIHQHPPHLEGETRPEVQQAWKVNAELTQGSTHVAILAMR
jgi:hypothetical protein